jgi:hypothetical protein
MRLITIEIPGRPVTANKQRGKHSHWSQSAADTGQFRFHASVVMRNAMKAHRVKPGDIACIEVEARQLSKDGRWLQDLGACFPAVKAAIDGLVDARLIPDDTPQYLTRLSFIPPDICGRDALRLTITTHTKETP